MAIDWGAFVKGWAGSAADSLKERDKEERDMKMREQLAALQEKYKIQEEDREEARAKRKVDKDLSYIDYASGQRVFTNSEGVELRREAAPASALEDREFDVSGKKLGLENIRSQISSRAAGDRNDAIRTANDGARTRASIEGLRASSTAANSNEDRGTTPADRLAMNVLKQAGIKVEGTAQLDELNEARAAVLAAARQGRPDLAFAIYTKQKLRK